MRKLVPLNDALPELGGIGRSTLYALIDAEKIERVHIGRRAFITRASLDAYLKGLVGGAE